MSSGEASSTFTKYECTKDGVAAVAELARKLSDEKTKTKSLSWKPFLLPTPAREWLHETQEALKNVEKDWALYAGLGVFLQPELDTALTAVATEITTFEHDFKKGVWRDKPEDSRHRAKVVFKNAELLSDMKRWANLFREKAPKFKLIAEEPLEWTAPSFERKLNLLKMIRAHFANVPDEIKPAHMEHITAVVDLIGQVMKFAARPAPKSSKIAQTIAEVAQALKNLGEEVPALTTADGHPSTAPIVAKVIELRSDLQALLDLLEQHPQQTSGEGGIAKSGALESIAEEQRSLHQRMGRRMAKRYGLDL